MQLPDALPRNFTDLAAFTRAAWERFDEDHCMQIAGSLAYTTLLALVPLLTVALALITAFPVFGEFTSQVDDWLAANVLPEQVATAITSYLGQFAEQAARLTAVGITILGVTAVMLMLTIDGALNQIFRVRRPRPLMQQLLMYWAVLTLGPILMGASVSMTSYLVSTSLGYARGLPILGEALLRAVPVLLTSAAITLLYLWVPNRRVRARHAVIGGLIAGILFELMKRGFALYIAKFPTYTLIYGAFAAIPIFLVWLYLSWVVVLFGAAVTALIPGYQRAERRGRPAGAQFFESLDLLGLLVRAQRAGQVRALTQLARDLRLAPEQCERLLGRMEAAGWVAQAAGDGWVLAREAGAIRAADVYRLFVFDAPQVAERYAGLEQRMEATLAELFAGAEAAEEPERRSRRFELFSLRREQK